MKPPSEKQALSPSESADLLAVLKRRFDENRTRHPDIRWEDVFSELETHPANLWSIHWMEKTGGEPDVIGSSNGEFLYVDCSAETPKFRRSVCYDREGLDSRKEHKPEYNAVELAESMGIQLLTEDQYLELQRLGDFDLKTSSWLKTPPEIRKLGGAIFGDKRYGRTFICHNGAQSYYSSRGFRGIVRLGTGNPAGSKFPPGLPKK